MTMMKMKITLMTALLGIVAGKSPELNPTSFDEMIHSKNTFVKFYAPVSDAMSSILSSAIVIGDISSLRVMIK